MAQRRHLTPILSRADETVHALRRELTTETVAELRRSDFPAKKPEQVARTIITALVREHELRDSYAQQDGYSQLQQTESDKEAIRADHNAYLREKHAGTMEAIDGEENAQERRERIKELRKSITNALEDKQD